MKIGEMFGDLTVAFLDLLAFVVVGLGPLVLLGLAILWIWSAIGGVSP